MQLDMHFYGVYALCRAAGINEKTAEIIAHSSQYVDDALGDDTLVFKDGKTAILPTMTSHKPLDYKNAIEEDQWRVWVCFHFLPGNDPKAKTFLQRMVCIMNSVPAGEIKKFALKNKNEDFSPYLCGIVAHVYADTFAHYGFIGLSTEMNRVIAGSIKPDIKSKSIFKYVYKKMGNLFTGVKGTGAEIIPMGHGAVATLPDRPYLKWEYRYEKRNRKKIKRTNWIDFLLACQFLHQYFKDFLKDNPGKGNLNKAVEWDSISGKIEKILKKEGSKENRIEQWKKAIKSNSLFIASNKDENIRYNEKAWHLSEKLRKKMFQNEIKNQHLYHFYKAAWKYRNYVLHELLPQVGIIK